MGTHKAWRQHPLGHEDGVHSQAPVAPQLCPAAQLTHRAPPVPQALFIGAVTHNSFASQQPVGHVVGSHPVMRSGAASAEPSGPSAAPTSIDASPMLMSLVPASFVVASVVVTSWMTSFAESRMTSFVGRSDRTSIALASTLAMSVRASAGALPAAPPESAPAMPPRPPAPPGDASLPPVCPAAPPVDEDPLSGARCPGSKPSRSLHDADGRAVTHNAKIHPARRSNSEPPIAGGYCRCLKIMARQSKTPRR
jgi:hypothetical protein